ncbi:MAG: hypothetical protein Q4E65_05075 [Clostridia bacterium]|nr:hypothetical protein [Clostridia bacterium]
MTLLYQEKAGMLLSIYEITLDLDRFVSTHTDTDELLQKMQQTFNARKEKIEEVTLLDEQIRSLQQTGYLDRPEGEEAIRQSRETISAVLRNISALDEKIEKKIIDMRDAASGEMRDIGKTHRGLEAYYTVREEDEKGWRIDALK